MEILTIFVCFLIAESVTEEENLREFRTRSLVRPLNDVQRIMAELSAFGDFSQTLDANFSVTLYNPKGAGIFHKYGVHQKLSMLSTMFLDQCYKYVVENLEEYTQLAIEVVYNEFDGVPEWRRRELLRFQQKPHDDYCMLTAFYDLGELTFATYDEKARSLRWLIEILIYFQTIDPHVQSPIAVLESQLRTLRVRYGIVLRSNPLYNVQQYSPVTRSFREYGEAMRAVERKITDFSRKFCSVWRPFVKHHVLGADASLNDVRNQSPFIRYLLEIEVCMMDFKLVRQSNYRSEFHSVYEEYVMQEAENQQYRIAGWDCNKILDSPEYGHKQYKENAQAKRKRTENPMIDIKKVVIPPKPLLKLTPADKLFERKQSSKFSIVMLLEGLRSHTHYLNVVKFYNIMADIVLMVSIKEGDKILKGIRLAVRGEGKKKTNKLSADDVRKLRSTLFEYKSIFDDLVFLIKYKRRMTVRVGRLMKLFDERVNSILELLDINDDLMTERIFSQIPLVLKHKISNNAYLSDDRNDFYAFYFADPILHIRELYGFSANEF